MSDEAAERANEVTARFILRMFREETRDNAASTLPSIRRQVSDDAKHLADCPSAKVADQDAYNSTYGCDTGCDYARLEATITCDHGHSADYEYGEFGDLAELLEEIQREEAQQASERANA